MSSPHAESPRPRGAVPPFSLEPLPLLAAALVVGVVLGGRLVLVPLACRVGAVALAAVAALAGARRGGRVALWLGVAALGAALGAPRVLPAPLPDRAHVSGDVVSRTAKTALVETASGHRLRLRFRDGAPPVGTELSAWTRSVSPSPLLPGEPDRHAADLRRGIRSRRVEAWVSMGGGGVPTDLPPPFSELRHGGLLYSLATGNRRHVSADTAALLQATGTGHLLAISGLHVGLLAGLGLLSVQLGARLVGVGVASPTVRWVASLVGVGLACAYANDVGWPTSARRAVVMVAMAALARGMGRRLKPWTLLAQAALVVVALEPGVVEELGFGLSFGAVVGILAVSPRLTRLIPPDVPRLVDGVLRSAAVSMGALLGTLPLTAWWLQELSPWSPVANVLAGPLIGAVGVPAALLGHWVPGTGGEVAAVVGDAAVQLAVWMLAPLATTGWAPAVGPVVALLLAAAGLARFRPLLACGLVAGALVVRTQTHPDDVVVTFLDVGQGDAVFVAWPDGRRWLVDGGPPSDRVLRWLRRSGHTHLDAVFLTHPDSDHLGGLEPVLEMLQVDAVWVGRPPRADEQTYQRVWQTLGERGIPVHLPGAWPGEGAAGGSGGRATLLHPMPAWRTRAGGRAASKVRDNDDSLVLRIEHAGHSLLLTGDIEASAEAWLAPSLGPVDVIQAPHHGSRSSSTSALVAATDPDWVIVSCGRDNRFGHPHAQTLAQWRGRSVVRTEGQGSVEVRLSTRGIEVGHRDRLHRWRPAQNTPWHPLLPPNPEAHPTLE